MRLGNGPGKSGNGALSRLERLAQKINALAKKDELALGKAHEIFELRRLAAHELHAICAEFVKSVNQLLPQPIVDLDPPGLKEEGFIEDGGNLLQINVRGRILQVEFRATPELISTEEFRVPYILAGNIRAFNQALLDKDLIEEQLLFYTLEKHRRMWRYFDARTYHTGAFDAEYLTALMEQIV